MEGFVGSSVVRLGRKNASGSRRVCVVQASLGEKVGAAVVAAGALMFGPRGAFASQDVTVERERFARTELVATAVPAELLDERDIGSIDSTSQLRSKKMTRFSGAQQEMIELDAEWEQLWYIRFLQYALVVCVVPTIGLSAAGLGKLFEAWTKAQEEAEREEEIRLTGSYSNPSTVRKEDVDDDTKKDGEKGSEGGSPDGSNPDAPSDAPKSPSAEGGDPSGEGSMDDEQRKRLEQLFGRS